MLLPESWTERLPFLEAYEEDWLPVSRIVFGIAAVFYLIFLYQLWRGSGPMLMMDLVFIPIHEGGHLLFRFFGEWVSVAGGTFLQLAVPGMLASYFAYVRQVPGVAFCMFFFFEQFLPTATYMADARAQELPLLTVGDAEYVIHDWNYLFTSLGVIEHDIQIAHAVRVMGWMGMLATVGWMAWRTFQPQQNTEILPSPPQNFAAGISKTSSGPANVEVAHPTSGHSRRELNESVPQSQRRE